MHSPHTLLTIIYASASGQGLDMYLIHSRRGTLQFEASKNIAAEQSLTQRNSVRD